MSVSNAISSRDPVTGERQISLESEHKEIERSRETVSQLLAEAKKHGIRTDKETPQYERVNDVFQRLLSVVHRKQLPWEVHVIEKEDWNAFTIGGGKVFVFTGIFESDVALRSDDELAAVLAHEMAHVAARHASEGKGKQGLLALVDKDFRSTQYKACFTTIQEDEADRYSVLYCALAGFDPSAGIRIWERLHVKYGSNPGNYNYDHPLSNERAENIAEYARKVQKYYSFREINENYAQVLENNELFKKADAPKLKAGEGGGVLSLFETAATTFSEAMEAKAEQQKRERLEHLQTLQASKRLKFKRLKIANARGGGKGLFGVVVNATGKSIVESTVEISYLFNRSLVFQEKIEWQPLRPYQSKQFGIPLRPLRYTNIALKPVFVRLNGE